MDKVILTTNFTETLECPICYDYFTSPVILCPNGHSICNICGTTSKTCPVCRAQLSKTSRNIVLEKMLEQISVPCKFQGCQEVITLASRSAHYKVCPYNNFTLCIECGSSEEDLVRHLISQHDYKEIAMEEEGGLRSFSGPLESWGRDTEWPKGVWRFGKEPIIVHAKSTSGVFHVYLFRINKKPLYISLEVENEEFAVVFKGQVPFISDENKKNAPHLNCDVSVLLNNFVKVHDEDEEILRLWVNVKRKLTK